MFQQKCTHGCEVLQRNLLSSLFCVRMDENIDRKAGIVLITLSLRILGSR